MTIGGVPPRPLWLLDHAPILGGAELFALRLARYAQLTRGCEVRFVCPGESQLARRCLEEDLAICDARFPDLTPWRAVSQLLAVARVRRLLRDMPGDAVAVTVSARAQAYTIAAAVSLAHPPAVVHLALEQETARRRSARLALPRHGSVLALGANTAAAYRQALPGVNVGQLNNFLTAEEIAELRDGNGTEREPGALGVLARMIPDKGILELVQELSQVGPGWSRLLVAGPSESPDYERAVRRRVHDLGLDERVELLGRLPSSRALLQRAAVLVVPSTGSEGQPTVILEALAAGIPAVVRRPVYSEDYAGLPVFPYTGVADLGRALERALEAETAPTSDVLERFGPEQALSAIEQAAQG